MPSEAKAGSSRGSTASSQRPPRLSFPASFWNRRKASYEAPSSSSPLSPLQPSAASASTSSTQKMSNSASSDSGFGRSLRSRTRSGFSALLSPHVGGQTEQLDPLLTAHYPDPEAVNAFMSALLEDQGKQEPPAHAGPSAGAASAWTKLGLPTLKSPPVQSPSQDPGVSSSSPSSDQPALDAQDLARQDSALEEPTQTVPLSSNSRIKVGKIAAVSDFAPIRERTASRRGSGKSARDSGRREGLIYAILRWPLLFAIFVTIGLEFFAYVLTRQIVNVVEWLVAHRGKKGVLRRQMRKAKTFTEWRDTALELDDFMDHEQWKVEDASGLYDWILIKKVLHSLKTFRQQEETQELMAVLELCCRNNFAGTENFRLYSETYYGTKYLIESYLAEVELGMQYVAKTDKIPVEQKRAFFRGVSKNLGRSGLCLSGGGAFGYYHVGLVKALLDADLLPKIVSGTSAGGLIAALTCTRTDEELSRLLVPELADRITACEEPIRIWAARAWKTGARFDPLSWAEKASFFTMGSMTFKEAFERTGKTLNVSVIPSDKHSPTKLLNHLTAPRCVIWSALLASAAVPGLLPPVCLMQKTRKGDFVPWNWGHRFKDGSLRVDIPLQDLHSMFHVNYPIVSQVNPHVHLFFFAPKGMPGRPVAHRRGKGWRGGFVLSASEHVLKLHLSLNFKVIRDLDLLPAILGTDWSSVFLQRFDGAVTIWPKTRFMDWIRILSDPDRGELARMMKVGQAATYPKLHMIENRIRIERAVEAGRKACRQAIRKQQRAAGELQTPGGGLPETPNQDSGTDASVSAYRKYRMQSDTEGEGLHSQQQEQPSDYFQAKPPAKQSKLRRPQGTNMPNSLAAARRRFGNAMGLRTFDDEQNGDRGSPGGVGTPGTDGAMTPSSEIGTPGELPRPSRARSAGMHDGEDVSVGDRHSRFRTHRQRDGTSNNARDHGHDDGDEDECVQHTSTDSQDTVLDVDKTIDFGNGSSTQRHAYDTPTRALTAADLTPQMNRYNGGSSTPGSRRNSRQSMRNSYSNDAFFSPRHHHHHRRQGSGSRHDGAGGPAGAGGAGAGASGAADWAANRGSIGPESPWDQQDDDLDELSSSDTSSEAEDAA